MCLLDNSRTFGQLSAVWLLSVRFHFVVVNAVYLIYFDCLWVGVILSFVYFFSPVQKWRLHHITIPIFSNISLLVSEQFVFHNTLVSIYLSIYRCSIIFNNFLDVWLIYVCDYLLFIGDMGVGKSCLLHQFTEKKCKCQRWYELH